MRKVPFWNSSYPFRDLLLCSFRENKFSENQLQKIKKESLDINLAFIPQKSYGEISNFVIAQDFKDNNFKDETIFFSGVAQLNNKFYFGEKSLLFNEIVDREICDSVGNFTLINVNDDNIKITQDFFGCGILFYFKENDFFVVSNRYHLLLIFLSWIGHKGKLNKDKVITTLCCDNPFFIQNVSSEMDIKGVNQLSLDYEVKIDKNGWNIIPKEAVVDAWNGCNKKDYYEFLQKGKVEVINNIQSVLESNLFEKVITDLSGGMDSRVVLGAILNIEDAIKKIEIYTKDIPGSLDLQIATGFKNFFGGEFYKETGRPQYPITISDGFDIWRSYFMGTYYELGLGAWSPKGENNSQVRLSGGYGELYRPVWYDLYKKTIDTNSIEELVNTLINYFSCTSSYPDINNAINEVLVNEMNRLPGNKPIDKLEAHYIFFRNRYHFGMRMYEYFNDCPIWFPLMSKSLFKASKSLSFEENCKNKFMLEITENMHPLLIWVDYASDHAFDKKLSKISLSDIRFKECKVLLDSNTEEWEAITKKNQETLLKSRKKMDTEFYIQWRNVNQYVKKEAINAFYELSNYILDLDSLLGENFINEIVNNSLNLRATNRICSKLNSLKDQIAIFE